MNRKHVLNAVGVFLVAVCFGLFFTQPAYARPGYFQVTVRGDHKPVIGAYVEILSPLTESKVADGYTDEKGRVTFSETWVQPNVEYGIYINYDNKWFGTSANTTNQASLNLKIEI